MARVEVGAVQDAGKAAVRFHWVCLLWFYVSMVLVRTFTHVDYIVENMRGLRAYLLSLHPSVLASCWQVARKLVA